MADDNRKHTVDYKEVELRILAHIAEAELWASVFVVPGAATSMRPFTRAATGRLSRPTDAPQLKNLPRVVSTHTGRCTKRKDGS